MRGNIYRSERKSSNFLKYIILIGITAFVTLFINKTIQEANEIDEFANRLSYENTTDKDIENDINEKKGENINYIEECLKSTVGISLLKPSGAGIFDIDLAQKWGLGTGIIVSESGFIVTNQHLAKVKGARLAITLNSGKSVQGRVIWNDENIDIAIIKIDEKNVIPGLMGDSDKLKVGDEVIAIGNPLGAEFQGTTTKGIISGLDRTILFEEDNKQIFMEGLIQTDASINPGNSGGPLINEDGEVIGINTVKITSAEGIGFAVPINLIKNIIMTYEMEGSFEEAYLGIYAYDREVIPYMDVKNEFDAGIYVVSIDKNGPCGNTILKKGDIITKIDDIEINKMTELREYLYSKKPGDRVLLTVADSEIKNLEIILGEMKK